MKKMLVVFLILFSKVLADSEENNYVDLLPDKEKQQFLDKVASRIMEDVQSPENATEVANGEVSDKLLKQHTEYVKTVFKDEQANLRKNRGNVAKEKITSSDDTENFEVKPLKTRRMAESVDPTSKDTESSDKTTTNNTTVVNVSNNVTVSNITVQNDNKTSESEETTTEKLNKVLETNTTKEKTENGNVKIKATVLPTNSSGENTNEKDSKVIERSDSSDSNDDVVLDKSNSVSYESDARNVSVKSIDEASRRSAGNITEDNSTTTVADISSSISAENNSVTYNNSSSSEGEVTTVSYSSEGNSTIDSLSASISSEGTSNESISIENTTTDAPSETTTPVTKDKDIEPLTNSTTTESDSKTTTESSQSSTVADEATTESDSKTTTESSQSSTVADEAPTESDSKTTTESPQSSTVADEETTDALLKTVPEIEITDEKAETTSVPDIAKNTTAVPVEATKEMKIIKEEFTLSPEPASTVRSTTVTPPIKKPKKKTSPQEVTTEAIISDEDTMEATTQKRVDTMKASANKKVKHKAIVYKMPKIIVGPKAKKIAEAKKAQNKNFLELQEVHFNNNYKVKVGKQYHVFEIPDGGTPFMKDEEPAAEQPYYVPVYNYSPNKAYFNPLNRLGPNPGDNEDKLHIIENNDNLSSGDDDDDDYNQQIERTETINVELKVNKSIDRQRKKFGTKQTAMQGFHKQPQPKNEEQNTFGNVNPEDYSDSDYYFGRIRNNLARTKDVGDLPNPGSSGLGRTLKDHLRAVRHLLYRHKNFGVLQNDEINGRLRMSKDIELVENADDEGNDKHFQKVGYLKGKNKTKEIFVMDDDFKENFDKFIEEKVLKPATPLPNAAIKNAENEEDSDNIKPDKNNNSNQSVKFNLRSNSVVKVSTYLQVLNDMVTLDNKALVKYDWLGTTVDIQAGLRKLFELITLVSNNEDIHPADMEILKYVLFLHNLASEIIEANEFGAELKKKLALQRKKKKNKLLLLDENGLINRLWLYLKTEMPKDDDYALKHLKDFLMNVEDSLFDLHEAIKNIATITKYNKQHWYQNLKDLYINLDDKHLLELLLHITTLRLFALVEESAKNGLEEGYVQYMKDNKNHAKTTLQEMMFIMKVLDEYKVSVE